MRNTMVTEQRWHKQWQAANNEAETLPHGNKREALERKSQQLETANKIHEWISSRGLEPPR
jgi:hypothetical protein